MAQLTGNEFNNLPKVTNNNLLIWIWTRIYPFINSAMPDTAAAITAALQGYATEQYVDDAIAQEVVDRDAAIATLQGALQTAIDAKTTTAEVATQITTAIDSLVAGAPAALNTLIEITDALAANAASDDATLNALNALITTVGTKADQADLDALSTVVGTKASQESVTTLETTVTTKFSSVLTKLKQIVQTKFVNFGSVFGGDDSTDGNMQIIDFVGANTGSDVLSVFDGSLGLYLRMYKEDKSSMTAAQFYGVNNWATLTVPNKADLDVIVFKHANVGGGNGQFRVFINPLLCQEEDEYGDPIYNFDKFSLMVQENMFESSMTL
jgi:hypothetical protein